MGTDGLMGSRGNWEVDGRHWRMLGSRGGLGGEEMELGVGWVDGVGCWVGSRCWVLGGE